MFFKKTSISQSCQTENDYTIYENESVSLKKMSIKDLLDNYNIKNWSKNRTPDEVRIQQIKSQYSNKECLIDGIISAWQKPNDNTLFIYDGIHRFTACKNFINNIVIIKILLTDNEECIIQDFKKINLSVSIPYLFLEDHNELKIAVCKNVMDLFSKKWSNNRSPSRNPWKCNFNRDVFIDTILSKLDIDFTIPNIDKILFDILLGINDQAKLYTRENSIQVYKKCHTYNFYIMYLSDNTIKNKIQSSSLLINKN